ncbi:unnamed protein product [Ambrosiozyma monospora]|uniref:Mitochondrial import inner membrane translocase subunit n=1 Tax=Ambrosiozyma monospora TaxID=43982 RepID=A0A9W6YN55_AMBMO|nr:unnamed protein product [Ambrosiozyma monospora]
MSDLDLNTLSKLDETTKTELNAFIQQETARAKVQTSVTQFTDMCFKKCITSVQDSNLNREEESCVSNCLNRFLDTNIKIVNLLQNLPK